MLLWTTVYSPMIFYIYYNVMNRSHHVVFPAFQADVFMKVEPIKVHLVSYTYWYMIQGFVSDGLYRMVKSCISTEYTMYIFNVRLYFLLQYSYRDDGDLHTDTGRSKHPAISWIFFFFFFFRFWNGNCLNFSSISQNFQNCSFV